MSYLSVSETAKKWGVSERSVRNYCTQGRVQGAFSKGKTWNIPADADKPVRLNKSKADTVTLLDIFRDEKKSRLSGGIYHMTQIEMTYNSNHMERSYLTDTCLTSQDRYKEYLDYFRIGY